MVVLEPWRRRGAVDGWPPTMRQIEHAARNASHDVSNEMIRLQNVTNRARCYRRNSSTRSQRARHDSVKATASAAAASDMTHTSAAIDG